MTLILSGGEACRFSLEVRIREASHPFFAFLAYAECIGDKAYLSDHLFLYVDVLI